MINWDDQMKEATERDDRLALEREGRILGQAATAPGPGETSLYEQAMAAAAARRGAAPETIMEEDYRGLAPVEYPSPECLTPDELETIYLGDSANPPDWVKARLRHLNDCTSCRALSVSIHPDAEARQQFERAMGQAFAAKAAAAGATGPKKVLIKIREVTAAAIERVWH